jgi:hypothetical protein
LLYFILAWIFLSLAAPVADELPAAVDSSESDSDSEDSDDSDMDSSDDDDDDEGAKSQLDADKESVGGKLEGEEEGLQLDEDDPVIQAIAAAQETKKSDHPADLALDRMPTSICFHSKKDLIAVSTYDGDVEL